MSEAARAGSCKTMISEAGTQDHPAHHPLDGAGYAAPRPFCRLTALCRDLDNQNPNSPQFTPPDLQISLETAGNIDIKSATLPRPTSKTQLPVPARALNRTGTDLSSPGPNSVVSIGEHVTVLYTWGQRIKLPIASFSIFS